MRRNEVSHDAAGAPAAGRSRSAGPREAEPRCDDRSDDVWSRLAQLSVTHEIWMSRDEPRADEPSPAARGWAVTIRTRIGEPELIIVRGESLADTVRRALDVMDVRTNA